MILAVFAGFILKFQSSWTTVFGDQVAVLLGAALSSFQWLLKLVAEVFVSSLKLIVVPLVFISLVSGVASLKDLSRLGPMGAKTFGLYLASTAIAVTLALVFGILVGPGREFSLGSIDPSQVQVVAAPTFMEVLVGLVPQNPVKALADGNMLQIIFFSFLLGFAIQKSGEHGRRIAAIFSDLNEVVLRLVTLIMWISPFGVFAILTRVVSEQGFDALYSLGKYFFLVVFVLLLHGIGVYSLMLKYLARLKPSTFFKKFRDVAFFSFGTASSNATIPVTMETAEHKMGVSNSVASFTIPLGATVNMDGTAIMQGVATAFIAQVYGIELSVGTLLGVVMSATLASVGTAGVPGVGLITLAMVLKQANVPVDGIALVMGVDRLLDMLRTTVNIAGDMTVTCIVAKSEGELDEKIFYKNS